MPGREAQAEARRWLRLAQDDVHGAGRILDDCEGIPRHACWLAQQGAEQALKALLVKYGVVFPRTDDLDVLVNVLPVGAEHVRSSGADIHALSVWATEARYPGDWEEATREAASRAGADARTIRKMVEEHLHLQHEQDL